MRRTSITPKRRETAVEGGVLDAQSRSNVPTCLLKTHTIKETSSKRRREGALDTGLNFSCLPFTEANQRESTLTLDLPSCLSNFPIEIDRVVV